MLQVPFIRENRAQVIEGLLRRNFNNAEEMIDQVLELDQERRSTQKELDDLQAEANRNAKEIGGLYKQGKRDEAEQLKARSVELKDLTKELNERFASLEEKQRQVLYQIPNVPHPSVPKGNSDADNEVVSEYGDVPTLHEGALSHWDLASKYNLIDFELGVKITGAGFPVYTGKGARLQRALINYFLDSATQAGYLETMPPHMINEASGIGTGQLPDKEGQMYHATKDDLYLIPTAEVPVTNIYRDVILDVNDLPKKHTAYTPCFRREAGSYGKDVRGLNRLHQFDKVEIVQIANPEESYKTLDQMLAYVQGLLKNLELPYRTLRLCGGDLGFTSALTFDLEVYSAAQERWLEVSSISNFEAFQANRLKCRFRKGNEKPTLVHTLNGSALALPRVMAALLENHQTEKGIRVPEVLQPYTGFEWID